VNTRRALIQGLIQTTTGCLIAPAFTTPAQATARVREVDVLQCHVAGTTYAQLPDRYEEGLSTGQRLRCVREPDNPADALAIRIEDPAGRKVGYLPRSRNEVLARLLDAGLEAQAEVTGWERVGSWLRLEIRVLLQTRL
jgi:hypothetical protein